MLYCNLLYVTATSEICSTTTLTTVLPGPYDQVTRGKHLANLTSEIEEEGDLNVKLDQRGAGKKSDAASISITVLKCTTRKLE